MIAYSIIMFLAAILFLPIGAAIYRGNTKLIHDYHQTNINESERQEYGRAFAKGVFAIGLTLLLSGVIALFWKAGSAAAASVIVLLAGLTVSMIVLIKVQRKYNSELF